MTLIKIGDKIINLNHVLCVSLTPQTPPSVDIDFVGMDKNDLRYHPPVPEYNAAMRFYDWYANQAISFNDGIFAPTLSGDIQEIDPTIKIVFPD